MGEWTQKQNEFDVMVKWFSFSEDDLWQFKETLKPQKNLDLDQFIKELEVEIQRPALEVHNKEKGKVDRSNRAGQFQRFKKKVDEFESMLPELQKFVANNLHGGGDIHKTATRALTEVIRLNSLLESKGRFYKPSNGRPPAITDHVAESVANVFERFGLPLSKAAGGFFADVVSICLGAMDLPNEAPARAIRKIKTDHN